MPDKDPHGYCLNPINSSSPKLYSSKSYKLSFLSLCVKVLYERVYFFEYSLELKNKA